MATIGSLTTSEEVAKALKRDIRIVVGENEPADTNENDISYAGIDVEIEKATSEIVQRLSRFYVIPLSLSDHNTVTILNDAATNLAAYKCYLRIQPTMTRDQLPVGVQEWKKEYEASMERIVPTGKTAPLAGRDIILGGETLITSAGSSGKSAVAFTQFLPNGGS